MTAATLVRPTPSISDWPTLTGRQEPHILSSFPGSLEHGAKAATLAERARARPMPWQRDTLQALLARNDDGTWTHSDACIICPRQNGKSLILTLRILYGLFVLGETIIFTAQRWTTAEDIYLRTWALIEPLPSLVKRVKKTTCSQGRGVIELKSGAKVVFTTRSADAGRGLTKLDLVIYDEAYNLTDGEMSALGPAQLAAKDPQTIYTSSAVNQDEHVNGLVLTAIRARGIAGERELYFAEYCAPEDMDREDEATWQYANPSYGVIQTASKIRKLMRGFATKAGRKSFDVEILGRGDWPVELDAAEFEPAIDLDLWASRRRANPDLSDGLPAVGFDMSPDRSMCTIAAATPRADGGAHLEVIVRASTREAIAALARVREVQRLRAVVLAKSSPAASLEHELTDAGIEITWASEGQLAQACGAIDDDLDDDLLSHTGDQAFVDALSTAEKKNVGTAGAWAFDRRSEDDITPIVAAALARFGLWAEAEEPQPDSVYEDSDFVML
ncbi:hypothetical protein [Rhodococcus sp. BE178]|uniref:hypothetical protein n=1 Tax=Rhodococcus sp. BE178 TaxID=2817737 RepID=UPI003D190744